MLEITLVLIAVAAVGLIGFVATTLTLHLTAAIGLVWYHVLLYRFVSAKIPLPRKWWLSPATLHRHLTDAEQRRIRPWYRTGGVGFVLSVVGGLTAIAGLLLER